MKREVTFDTGDKMYHLEIDRANPYVVSGGSPGRVRRIADYLDSVDETIISDRGLATVHGSYKGVPITAFSSGMGPASVSIVMPEVIEACDDPNMVFLRLGTSGGLQKHLNIGDFVVTTEVERAESTSDKIMPPHKIREAEGDAFRFVDESSEALSLPMAMPKYKAFSDNDVRNALVQSANECKLDFQKVYQGMTRVVDDIYFDALESKGNYEGKALAVSMEFSVYCALRDRYNLDYGQNIRAGNLLMVSDSLAEEGEGISMTEFLSKKEEVEKAHITAGLETLVKLANA